MEGGTRQTGSLNAITVIALPVPASEEDSGVTAHCILGRERAAVRPNSLHPPTGSPPGSTCCHSRAGINELEAGKRSGAIGERA